MKASEFGSDNLMSEFEPHNNVDGGYVEPSRYRVLANWFADEDAEAFEQSDERAVVAEVKVDNHHH